MPSTRRRLDINDCSAQELGTIQGLPKPLARKVIAYRNRVGRFKKLDDLLGVRGVGEHMLSLISDQAHILPTSPRSRRSSRATSRAQSRANSPSFSFRGSRSRSPVRSQRASTHAIRPAVRSTNTNLSSPRKRTAKICRQSPMKPHLTKGKRNQSGLATKRGSRFKEGPVSIDSAQNVSIDLGKITTDGCNITLCGGPKSANGNFRQLLTINVQELDNMSLPSGDDGADLRGRGQTSSPTRMATRQSSILVEDGDAPEYIVVRDTTKTTESVHEECTPGPSGIPETKERYRSLSQTRMSVRESSPQVQERRSSRSSPRRVCYSPSPDIDMENDDRRRSPRSSPVPRTGSLLRRGRSRSPRRSPSRQARRRAASSQRDRLSRADVEYWLQDTRSHQMPQEEPTDVRYPLASSTPRRNEWRRGKRQRSPPPSIRGSPNLTPGYLGHPGRDDVEDSAERTDKRAGREPERGASLRDNESSAQFHDAVGDFEERATRELSATNREESERGIRDRNRTGTSPDRRPTREIEDGEEERPERRHYRRPHHRHHRSRDDPERRHRRSHGTAQAPCAIL